LALVATDLSSTDLLRGVPIAVLELVLARCTPVSLSAGEMLLSPERENYHVYVLLSGAFALHFNSPGSPEVRELLPGTSVGEMSVIDATRPSAYVIAKVPSQVLPIHRDLLLSLIDDLNLVARNLLLLMTRWIRLNTDRIVLDQQQIWELSNHANVDPLTGLYNRRWLDNALRRLVEQSRKGERPVPLAVFLVDVDHFKAYNDSHGHLGGDRALMALGEMLKTTLRPYDFSARFGGEEFLVVLPNTDATVGHAVAERLRLAVAAKPIALPDGTPLPHITVSIGLATNDRAVTPESMIAEADARLYEAKRNGRNQVR